MGTQEISLGLNPRSRKQQRTKKLFNPIFGPTLARDVRCVIGKHQFVSLGVILYVISSIHEPKVRATMKHVKVDTGFVVKDVQEYLLKLFQVENVVYGFEPGKKKVVKVGHLVIWVVFSICSSKKTNPITALTLNSEGQRFF